MDFFLKLRRLKDLRSLYREGRILEDTKLEDSKGSKLQRFKSIQRFKRIQRFKGLQDSKESIQRLKNPKF